MYQMRYLMLHFNILAKKCYKKSCFETNLFYCCPIKNKIVIKLGLVPFAGISPF